MDTSIAPGKILLGRYRIERVLGQGGMGIVVAARHIELGQLHAIKFLLPSMLQYSEVLERFLREARAAAKLQSDHVVRVSDVGRMEDGAPYMVMEYLEGCDLKALVSREGPLPLQIVLTYVLQVCDAIAEAHAAGIVHRDLKPANLFLVRRRGRIPTVKVLDFGISKHTAPEEVDLTNTNASLGSPMYMSPEQMSKARTVDGRSDIWAIGVILYELLAGTSPFRASTLLEVASKVLQEEPQPLREIRPDIPEGLVDVIARCLRKRREDRFADVEALMLALQGFVSRDGPGRQAMISTTGETFAAALHAPAETTQTLRVEKSAPSTSSPMGEPTSLTFGQTGKRQDAPKRRANFTKAIGALGILCVLGGFGWYATASDAHKTKPLLLAKPAKPANVNDAVTRLHPAVTIRPGTPMATTVEPVRSPVQAPTNTIETPKPTPKQVGVVRSNTEPQKTSPPPVVRPGTTAPEPGTPVVISLPDDPG